MDAASIEQMNKVRVSLGMAPLPVPGADSKSGPRFKSKDDSSESESEEDLSTLDKRQAAAGNNWQKLEAEKQEKIERQKRKDAAKKARDAAQRFSKLEGKGLGDEDGADEVDTKTWLLQQKKRQRKIEKARKLEEQLAEQEREQLTQYTSKDLAGVKVGHEIDEFEDATDEQILTLKDTEIGEESEDDELENADLRAKEKLRERLELKKRRPDYDPTDQEAKNAVLSKYDEEIEGKKQKRFTLDGQGTSEHSQHKMYDDTGEVRSRGVKINLDLLKDDVPTSDYVDPSTLKAKKPKKSKKEKKTRKKEADEDDIFPSAEQTVGSGIMQVDNPGNSGTTNGNRKRTYEFEDDEDLQAVLAEQRRSALKKRKKLDGAELARQMREEMAVDEPEPDDDTEAGGLVLDETSEFVANLKKPEAPDTRENKSRTPQPAAVNDDDDDEDEEGDVKMASYAEIAEAADREVTPTAALGEHTNTGLDEEDTMGGLGLGSALGLLRKRGLVSDSATEQLVAKDRRRAEFLSSKQNLIDEFDNRAKDDRERERTSGRWSRMSNRERDAYARQQNEDRERYLAKLLADQFNKEYRPDVKLNYHDEYGREMNQKEAFKHLSHMFHGKGSGKQKTEKRLKKIEDERKDMAKGVLNVGDEGGMMGVGGREGKRRGQAGVRLQ